MMSGPIRAKCCNELHSCNLRIVCGVSENGDSCRYKCEFEIGQREAEFIFHNPMNQIRFESALTIVKATEIILCIWRLSF